MALNRYVLTSTVTVPAGTITSPVVAGEPGTGGAAGFGNTSTSAGFGISRTPSSRARLSCDPAGPLYAVLSGSLRPYVQGQDDRGGAALSN